MESTLFKPYVELHGFKKQFYSGPWWGWFRFCVMFPFAFSFMLLVGLFVAIPLFLLTAFLLWVFQDSIQPMPLFLFDVGFWAFILYMALLFVFGGINTLSFFFQGFVPKGARLVQMLCDAVLAALIFMIMAPFSLAARFFNSRTLVLQKDEFAFGWETEFTWMHGERPNIGGRSFQIQGPGVFRLSPKAYVMFAGTHEEYEALDPASL